MAYGVSPGSSVLFSDPQRYIVRHYVKTSSINSEIAFSRESWTLIWVDHGIFLLICRFPHYIISRRHFATLPPTRPRPRDLSRAPFPRFDVRFSKRVGFPEIKNEWIPAEMLKNWAGLNATSRSRSRCSAVIRARLHRAMSSILRKTPYPPGLTWIWSYIL